MSWHPPPTVRQPTSVVVPGEDGWERWGARGVGADAITEGGRTAWARNLEAPLREFLRLAKDAEIEHPNLHVAHATLWEEGDVAVCGLGGELTEAEDRCEVRECRLPSDAGPQGQPAHRG